MRPVLPRDVIGMTYHPNAAARALITGCSDLIGLTPDRDAAGLDVDLGVDLDAIS